MVDRLSEQELRQMYHDEQMSMREIAKEVGMYPSFVCNLMKEYGIESRTNSESRLVNTSKPSKNKLKEMYLCKKMTVDEIRKVVGVCYNTVCIWMKEYGIESRISSESLIGKYTGENNGNWNGGTSFEPYCNKFNGMFKESIRVRDDYTCQLCGYEQKLDGQKLDVHHIHYDKENCYPDVVALCRSCNGKVNGNRDHWEQYFSDQLIERGLLNWSM